MTSAHSAKRMASLQCSDTRDRKEEGGCQGLRRERNGELPFNKPRALVQKEKKSLERSGQGHSDTNVLSDTNCPLKMVKMVKKNFTIYVCLNFNAYKKCLFLT